MQSAVGRHRDLISPLCSAVLVSPFALVLLEVSLQYTETHALQSDTDVFVTADSETT